ncbi:MAG: urea ABC transporter permease subunit UrtB [Verrucomicrobia bacterium]|nr:urea ABC transporter permease subunit UrtB [Verrucomicrobiota bacterium]
MNLKLIILIAAVGLWCSRAGGAELSPRESEIRAKLVEAILAEETAREAMLLGLGETGSQTVREVFSAWPRDRVFLYEDSENRSVPALLGEEEDAEGMVGATLIATGERIKAEDGQPRRFDVTEVAPVDTDGSLRKVLQLGIDLLSLSAVDPDARRSAVLKLGNSQSPDNIPLLRTKLAKEAHPEVRQAIHEALALLQLGSSDPEIQREAVRSLESMKSIGCLEALKKLASNQEADPGVVQAALRAVSIIEAHISWINFVGTIFRGVSLGSILLIVALGLAITFGLMGIINMAHGEMIAVGAYTCYVVQNLFGAGFGFSIILPINWGGNPISFGLQLPGLNASGALYESYFLFAIPLSFLMAALAGILIERAVIQFLYRRPLESLLATWGVSLVMQQCFRMVFGANNVQVNSPSWLLGHFSVDDIIFGYNRIFVVAFAVLIVIGTWLLLTKTPLGLLIRSVMQNRDMAACIGVRTNRVNMLTFALGSGLAGLAGAFLSQIGNVGPSLGQSYIVDSFMTVVVGGVGSIVGTVCSAIGIGTADQILQQVTGSPVTGKIVVLVAIILFLQWKPGGLFAVRNRSLD